MSWLWLMLWVLGGGHVELEVGIVDSAGVSQAFLCARVKATCLKEGPVWVADGLASPGRGGLEAAKC